MRYLVWIIAMAFTMSLMIGQAMANQKTSGQSNTGVQGEQSGNVQNQQQPSASGQAGVQGAQAQQNVAAQQLSSDQIKQIQGSLKDRGFDPGQVDGIMGPHTRSALQQFQQSQGIASTGKLNQQTLQSLDLNTQEFMGVAPKFGEKNQQQQQEKGVQQGQEKWGQKQQEKSGGSQSGQ